MRKLKTSDIPAFCRCLKQIGIKDKIQEIARDSTNTEDAFKRGFDLLWSIFDLATESAGEQHLYEFLAGPFEMTAQEVADLEISTLLDNLKQLAAENDLTGFFKYAGRLMK